MNMNPVVHFEMPAKDKKRAAAFYTKVFGWKTNQLGKDFGYYMTVQTTESDDKGMPLGKNAINGGFYAPNNDQASHCPHVVIAVDDIRASMKAVAAAGGKVEMSDPDMIPNVGLFAAFTDPDGNHVAMLQPTNM